MRPRYRIVFLFLALIAGHALVAEKVKAADKPEGKPPRKPNLVFVFSDQQSSDMLGCYGNPDLITPNLDRLAAQGVRFNHCISNSPLCTPYRAIRYWRTPPPSATRRTNFLQ